MNYIKHDYGTKEYYAEMFADFIADIHHDSPEVSDNLIAGFLLALDDWREYHVQQTQELDRVKTKLTTLFGHSKQLNND